jgi:MFS family permease
MPGERHPTLEALSLPDLRNYMVSRFFSVMARSALHATVAWHVYDLTGKEFWLAVQGAVEFLPVIPVAFVAGALADRSDRRDLIALTRLATLLCALGLALGGDLASRPLALLLGMAFLIHTSDGFEFPAAQALLPALVPREIFQSAVVVSATVRNAAFASGPVLAGLAIEAAGPSASYALTALLLALSLLALLRVRRPGASDPAARVDLESFRAGLSFLRRQPAVVGAMAVDMLAVIFADPKVLLAVFAERILSVGPAGYGVLSGSMAAGTFLAALALLPHRGFERPGGMLLIAVFGFGLAAVGFGLSTWFSLSVACLMLAGVGDQVSQVTRTTIIQLSTPDVLRGRVSAVNMVFVSASNQFGAAFTGFLAAATSAVFATVAGGAACVATAGVVAARVPALRRYRVDSVRGV